MFPDPSSLGRASIDPAGPVVAGSYGTWRLTYTAGQPLAPGARLRVYTECDTDWAMPQLLDPAGPDYLTVQSPPETPVSVRIDSVKALTLFVHGRGLAAGESLTVTYGDTTRGGPGSRAQCFAESRRYFHIDIAPDLGAAFINLPNSLHLSIVGGDAVRLIVLAPSTVATGDAIRILVRAEDAWGNPAAAYRGTVTLDAGDAITLSAAEHTFAESDAGLWWLEARVSKPGLHVISAQGADLATQSNPIFATSEPPAHTLHWGDPHGGQIADARKIPDFFRYARDAAAISFAGYQRNDHAHSTPDYVAQQAAEREYDEPGRFVPLPGFEWSAEPSEGGHHNVYFRRHGQPMRRNSHWDVEDLSDKDADLPHVTDLYRAYRGTDTLITPHVGGEHANLDYHEPTLEPALEITSTHGSFEWFLRESLERRYQMGFVGGSDSHDGRPGADSPGHQERRYAKGGLTALYLRSDAGLTLDSVHEALGARRCYATTGARILADVRFHDHVIGSSVSTSTPPTLSVSVHGTAPLESVELYRGLDLIHRCPLPAATLPDAIRVLWQGASRKMSYSGVRWDGALRVEGATIARVEQIRFDSPRSHVFDPTPSSLRWHSIQCGYRSGLILHLEPQIGADLANATLHVAADTTMLCRPLFGGHGDEDPARMAYSPGERLSFSTPIAALSPQPHHLPLGILDRSLTLSMAPSPENPRSADFTFADPSPQPGINPYWLRVIQQDMEMAWTSPIFVDYLPTESGASTVVDLP